MGIMAKISDWMFVIRAALRFAMTRGMPDKILYYGISPGDDLLCTSVLRELRKRDGNAVIAMLSNFPDLFIGSHDATYVIPVGSDYAGIMRQLSRRQHHCYEYQHSPR